MTKKLYRVTTRKGNPGMFYVVATGPTAAYKAVRVFLDENDFFFTHERELDRIELIAEHTVYPDCATRLLFGEGGPS